MDEFEDEEESYSNFNILGQIFHTFENLNSKQECQAALGCRLGKWYKTQPHRGQNTDVIVDELIRMMKPIGWNVFTQMLEETITTRIEQNCNYFECNL